VEVLQDGDASYAVVGQVSARYHFSRPADFQFMSSYSAADYSPSSAPSHALLEVVPRPFSRRPAASANEGLFRKELLPGGPGRGAKPATSAPAAAAPSSGGGPAGADTSIVERLIRLSPWMAGAAMVAAGEPIPLRQPKSYRGDKWRRVDNIDVKVKALLEWMKRAFERRAAWRQAVLFDTGVCSKYLFKDAMVMAAFYFTTGPLKDYWVRWGYDPARDPQSRLLQPVQVRLSSAYWRDLNARVWNRLSGVQRAGQCINLDTMSWAAMDDADKEEGEREQQKIPMVLFETKVKASFAFQVNSLHAEELLEMVRRAKVLPAWDATTGWYSEEMLDLFSVRVLQHLQQKVDEFIAQYAQLGARSGSAAPSSAAARPAKAYEDQPGFSYKLWEWQERYEELPVVAAQSRSEIAESERHVGALVHPGYRSFKKLGAWTDSILKKIDAAAAKFKGHDRQKQEQEQERGGARAAAAPAVPEVLAAHDSLDYARISASQPFDTFASGSSEDEDDSEYE